MDSHNEDSDSRPAGSGSDLTVRPMDAGDAPRASAILNAAFRGFLGDKFPEDSPHFHPDILIATARVEDPFMSSRIFVAEQQGKVVGVVKVTAGRNGLGVFDYIGVDPDSHTRGVGSLLMAKAEEFWRDHHQRKIDTCVSAHNTKAIKFYLKHGFIPEGYRRDHFIVGVDEIILGRFLTAP